MRFEVKVKLPTGAEKVEFNNAPDDFDNEDEKEEIRKELIKYFGSLDVEQFLELFQDKLLPLKQKAKNFEDQIYKINKPVSHTYEIIKNKMQ